MKKWYTAIVIFSTLMLLAAARDSQSLKTEGVVILYIEDVKKLNDAADSLLSSVSSASINQKNLIEAYHLCRFWYKRGEAITEYFYPGTAKLLNGPAITEAEMESGIPKVVQPEGLQVIAEFIYADSITEQERLTLVPLVWRFISACRWLKKLAAKQTMQDWQVMDAMKLEIVRVFSLGITGFDTPRSGRAMNEAAIALEGVENYLQIFLPDIRTRDVRTADDLTGKLNSAVKYLTDNDDFESFDRMKFIRNYANPAYSSVIRSCEVLEIQWPRIPSAISRTAATIFEKEAMNPWYYARDNREEMRRPEIASLGELLFFDPILSGDHQRACASCHQPNLAFTDSRTTSLAFSGNGNVNRNSPTIINAAFQASYFYDVRANFLEDQIRQVVNNSNELHGDFSSSISLLKTSKEYRQLFAEAFKGTRDTAISSNAIVAAIAAYERTLVSTDSRFDKHIRREGNFLSKSEILGFNIFMGKAQCGTCHFLPMFNGTVPPHYTKSESEIIGVPLVSDTTLPAIDTDPGRLLFSGLELHRFAFKTPGLRNVALTAPYMHNGVFRTLHEVVEFYNRGGAAGAGENLPSQTLSDDRLGLTSSETEALVNFMQSLTDTVGLTRRPSRLPEFDNQELNKRKIGGAY